MSDYNSLYDWLESCKLVIYIDNFVQGGFDMSFMAGLTTEVRTNISVKFRLLSGLPVVTFPQEAQTTDTFEVSHICFLCGWFLRT